MVDWGYACRTLGRLKEAQRAFAQMTRLGEKLENLWTTVTGHIDQGSVLRAQGRLGRALRTYQAGLDLVCAQTAFAPGFVGRLESLLAMVHYELNDLAQAHRLAEDSLRHNQGWRNPNHDTHAWLARALVALAEADAVQAGRALAEAGEVVAKGAVARLLQSSLEAVRVRYWLAAQDMAAARQWAEARAPRVGQLAEMLEPEQLALARVWVAAGEKGQAMPLLITLEAVARAAGGMTTLVETLALRALAETASGAALEALQSAVTLGEGRLCASLPGLGRADAPAAPRPRAQPALQERPGATQKLCRKTAWRLPPARLPRRRPALRRSARPGSNRGASDRPGAGDLARTGRGAHQPPDRRPALHFDRHSQGSHGGHLPQIGCGEPGRGRGAGQRPEAALTTQPLPAKNKPRSGNLADA